MATGTVQISDVVVPDVFTPYARQQTEEKSRLIQSGALVRQPLIDNLLAGGGLTFDMPSFRPLDNEEENSSTDDVGDLRRLTGASGLTTVQRFKRSWLRILMPSPRRLAPRTEIGVRVNRNQSWETTDLAGQLAGTDPMGAIADAVSTYWQLRLQAMFISIVTGIFADNDAAPTGTEHVAGDLTNDISASSPSTAAKQFSADAFIDALATIGDSENDLSMIMTHSIVYARMKKNNLIDFIPDARGEVNIPTYLGRQVIVDDATPKASGVYNTWVFGVGAFAFGVGSADVPTAVTRDERSGKGGGSEILHNRVEWLIHPVGHKYAGTATKGGPTNAATSNNFANASTFERVFPQRKQIKIARLITRES